ncbi:NADP-dependent oxidoreductase [Streptomyces sp. B1866]|uniref:MDR family NADP-dependent oxidoreductase n=1 Tax=Streptomyces sp. B1866 TaxID=3075431 RepID=UPI00288E5DD7|nr:NADP-dependent oxidoreductase [Streptomyces sp. B1866]MDT3396723.1 NADP-dependent oxidoreductase [Streptomyces sp. B1866]
MTAVPATHREVRLAVRPRPGEELRAEHFEVAEAPVPVPGPGQVLVRNRVMSVTAVMRTLMNGDADLFVPPFAEGEPLWGLAVGEVVAAPDRPRVGGRVGAGRPTGPGDTSGPFGGSGGTGGPFDTGGGSGGPVDAGREAGGLRPGGRGGESWGAQGRVTEGPPTGHPRSADPGPGVGWAGGPPSGVPGAPDGGADPPRPGDLIEHRFGWREYAVVDSAEAHRLDPVALPDPAAYLSQGPSAWMGVVRGADVRPDDTVFVTGAAGGVGSLAGQIARLRGAKRVIGSTGSPDKADRLLAELGYDAVVVRGAGPIEDQLREAAPDGLDAVFDNVGGEQLRAALAVARRGARFAVVGALSAQAGGGTAAPVQIDTVALTDRGITLRGIALYDHMDVIPEWTAVFARGLREGTLSFPHVRLQGIGQAPRALRELLAGRHVGTVLVDL